MSLRTRVQCICSLFVLVPIHCFFLHKQLPIVERSEHVYDDYSSIVGMGGYYAEPESTLSPSSGRHMIFGIPCIEETLVLGSALQLKNLVPISDEEEGRGTTGSASPTSPILFQYLLNHVDFRNKAMVEIGATGVSIAAALAWGAASVVVCHPDPDRLRLWEHSLQFFNERPLPRSCQVLASKCCCSS